MCVVILSIAPDLKNSSSSKDDIFIRLVWCLNETLSYRPAGDILYFLRIIKISRFASK
jgi:hypothetical protein